MESKLKSETKQYAGTLRTGTETFTYKLPDGVHYSKCQFNVTSMPAGGGANLIEQPSQGATGQIVIKLVWWLAAIRPFPPGVFNRATLSLTLDVYVDDVQRRGKAIVVCIENTGEFNHNLVPFPYHLSDDQAMI